MFGRIADALFSVAAFALVSHAYAQDSSGNALDGQQIAERWCVSCHEIRPEKGGGLLGPPNFQAIADLPTTNALSLAVFFQSTHENMPDIHLTLAERDNLIAYILSLKKN